MNNVAEESVKRTIDALFGGLASHQYERVAQVWHPEGKFFIGGIARAPSFFHSVPYFVEFAVQEITHIHVCNTIASVGVKWLMKMPESVGTHVSYFNLIKAEDDWLIISGIDHGAEEKNK